jgi:hypothetical protein
MKFFQRLFPQQRAPRKSATRLTVEVLESRDLLSTLSLTPLVQASGPSPFAGSTADNPASQPGFYSPNSEAEPYLAVNPTNAKNVVAVWQQDLWSNGGGRGVAAGVSFDGGNSWREVVIPGITLVSGGPYQRAADNWLSFAPNGDLYEITLAGNVTSANGHPVIKDNAVLVSKSTDGGLTWGDPIPVVQDESSVRFDDKDSITADPTNSNFVYAVWHRINNFQTANNSVTKFARSTDGGLTWEAARDIFSSPNNDTDIGHQILVRPDGALIDLFTEITTHGNGPALQLMALRSTDKGLTWSGPIPAAQLLPVGTHDPDTGQATDQAEFLAHYAVDPDNGNLYAVWTDGRFSNFQYNGIAFTMSTDGGLMWSAPIRINQTPDTIPAADRQAFLPAVAVAVDGTVAVTYYDFRNNTSAAGVPTDYWLIHAHPADGLTNPASWHEENRLTDASFDFEQGAIRFGGNFVGDYEGLAAAGNSFFAAWAQPHGSDRDSIFFRDPPPEPGVHGSELSDPLPVGAHARPFKGVATGTVTGVDPSGAVVIAATGNATHLGDFTRTEYVFFGPDGTISGTVVFTAANGDQLWADFSGGFTSQTTLSGTYTFTGGTGRFSDATGTANFDATTLDGIHVAVSFDGSISY